MTAGPRIHAKTPKVAVRSMRRAGLAALAFATLGAAVDAQTIDWNAAGQEAARYLQEYVRIDTSNPPGDTRKAADFLAAILEHEGIDVTRYESAPGKAIVYGRLKATSPPPAGKAIVLLH